MPTKLEQLQLKFRQKLMQEKEERMIKIHTDSQQKALNKVMRYDANGPTTSHHQSVLTSSSSAVVNRKPSTIAVSQPHHTSPVKKSSPGVDRSRPLPPINRNGYNTARGNVSTFSGESSGTSSTSSSSYSARVTPPHNGVRSRSVDPDVDRNAFNKPSVKVKPKTDTYHVTTEVGRYYGSHVSNNGDRKSPDAEVVKPKQPEVQRSKVKASYEPPPAKASNGFTTPLKSSVEQRTIAGNSRSVHTISSNSTTIATQNRKPKATVPVVPRRVAIGAASNQSKSTRASKPIPRKPPNPNQEQCRHCGRNFNKDRIEKHVSICSKAAQKKVKVFDATKMRVKGTEAESFVKKGISVVPPKAKKTDWKKQHEDFINTIRQAKIAQRHLAAGGKLSDLPPPPPSDTSNYVPCPFCGRKFDDGVAQRHIPKCKNILSNKKTPMKKK